MMTERRVLPPSLTIRMLTDEQLDEIHSATLAILANTGVRVLDSTARELLQSAGSRVSDGDLVKIPEFVIEQALASAPSAIDLYSRSGDKHLELTGFNTYFGTGSDLPYTVDLVSSERRPSVLADVKAHARLCDCLENLDFVMSMAQAADLPVETSDCHAFLAMMENTEKPIVYTAWNTSGLETIIAMAARVAGGVEALAARPFMLAYLEPTSPLVHSPEVLAKMLMLADRSLPFVYAPGPMEGASAPVTSAGSLAMANAECLSGLAIAQLRRPGTPVVFGSGSGPLDMRTSVGTYSSPEFMHHCLGMAELAHHRYDLPVWGFSGCSDSKLPDIQAGIDSALWILWTALSGANLVHDLGYIESGLTGSFEMVVVADEVISFVRRLLGGMEVSPTTLALEVIDEVGPGGEFLSTAHTLANFRSVWQATLFDRRSHHDWVEAGRPNMIRTARETAIEAIGSHVPEPMTAGLETELRELVDAADRAAGVGS